MLFYDGRLCDNNNKVASSGQLQNKRPTLHNNPVYEGEHINNSNHLAMKRHTNPLYDSDQSSTSSESDNRLCVNEIYGKI